MTMDIEELKKILQNAGIVGAGGAGFPTYAKLDMRADTLLLNCAECEPLLKLHRQLLTAHAEEILSALETVAETVNADRAIVCVKAEYKSAVEAVQSCMGRFPKVQLHLLQGVYPMGDEVVLAYEATGRVIRPGGLPIEAGITVFNVETMYNVSRALADATPVTKKLVSVVGEVENPVTVWVPLGTSIGDVIAFAGKIRVSDPAIILGGPMMGRKGSIYDTVTRTTNAVLVLSSEHSLVNRMNTSLGIDLKRAASVCCQCRSCTDMCPRHALGHPIEPHMFMRAASNNDFRDTNVYMNTFFCSSCGVCELFACPQGLSPRTLIGAYKGGLRKAGIKAPADPVVKPVNPSREYRKVPEGRLQARLGLTKYDVPAPMDDSERVVSKVKELLSQHIGAPAVAAVKKGGTVRKGDVIGAPGKGLSVPVHASIDGTVTEVTDKYIEISAV